MYSVLRKSCAVRLLYTLYLVLEAGFLISGLCDLRASPPLFAGIVLTCLASVCVIRPARTEGLWGAFGVGLVHVLFTERFGLCQVRVALIWHVYVFF
jgi:hypothetical protein